MNNTKKSKLPLYIGIPAILLMIFLWFGLYFLKTDSFSGVSMLFPILLLCCVFWHCVRLLHLQRGCTKIVKGAVMTLYCGQL